jgi:hypothetical protein
MRMGILWYTWSIQRKRWGTRITSHAVAKKWWSWLYSKRKDARKAPKVAAPEETTMGAAAPLLVAADWEAVEEGLPELLRVALELPPVLLPPVLLLPVAEAVPVGVEGV